MIHKAAHLFVFRQERAELVGQVGILGQEVVRVGVLARLDVLQIRGQDMLQALLARHGFMGHGSPRFSQAVREDFKLHCRRFPWPARRFPMVRQLCTLEVIADKARDTKRFRSNFFLTGKAGSVLA